VIPMLMHNSYFALKSPLCVSAGRFLFWTRGNLVWLLSLLNYSCEDVPIDEVPISFSES
jgi:hypothetical protein